MLGSTIVTIAATCSPNVGSFTSGRADALCDARERSLSTQFFSVTFFSILTTTVITRVFKASVSSIVSLRIGFVVFTSSSRYLAIAMEQHCTERLGGLKRHQLYDALLPSLPDDHRTLPLHLPPPSSLVSSSSAKCPKRTPRISPNSTVGL
ncbi:hypothetical protein GYMLUDRAFT_237282 [Collybiopsis luxurians FD-317 M1]|nr:hypothetical protein GYMLUDRAFT_237282 [Collybiopsis luxurians FD-317 M1]